MFKTLFRLALLNLTRQWMAARTERPERAPSPIHINTEELKTLLIRLGSLTTLVFLNFLLFVGAVVVTAVATAHSFDLYDHFETTAVFWTGLIMGFTALALGGFSAWALARTKITAGALVILEPEEETANLRDRLFTPVLEGFLEGLRARPRPDRSEEPAHPAA